MISMIRERLSCSSTQDELKSWLQEGGVRHLDAVLSGRQTSGRGRQGAEWISSEGNFFASVYLVPGGLPLTWIPLRVGVAVHEALTASVPVRIGVDTGIECLRLKWPNDLVLAGPSGDAKLGGILCEKVEEGVVAGIGINIQSAPALEGREISSLSTLGGSFGTGFYRELLEDILGRLAIEPGPATLQQRFEELSVFEAGGALEWIDPVTRRAGRGIYEGLGRHGELLVRPSSGGEVIRLFSEEVRRLSRSKGKDPAQ
jgi:BirA family biotin operon repressor/biotin-[acetyl-CoA-carboxylase] ligase